MKFNHTYIYRPSYFNYLSSFVALAAVIGSSFIDPRYTMLAIPVIFLVYYQLFYLKNKLMVGVNAEGVCIWQKRDIYLVCPLRDISNLEVRRYRVKGIWCYYLHLEHQRGMIYSFTKSLTYAVPGQEIDLKVLSMRPTLTKEFSFYIAFSEIQGLEREIKVMRAQSPMLDSKKNYKNIL